MGEFIFMAKLSEQSGKRACRIFLGQSLAVKDNRYEQFY